LPELNSDLRSALLEPCSYFEDCIFGRTLSGRKSASNSCPKKAFVKILLLAVLLLMKTE
jgi:hypothetical protein